MHRLARMHTAEHLLSAVMKIHFQAPRNLELHLDEKKTKCDYAVPEAIGETEVKKISELVNEQIARDLSVTDFRIHRTEAGDYDLWKVPADAEEIRIVQIGDFDAQPCSGNHVSHTCEIGTFEVLSCERRENGHLRIRFKVI